MQTLLAVQEIVDDGYFFPTMNQCKLLKTAQMVTDQRRRYKKMQING